MTVVADIDFEKMIGDHLHADAPLTALGARIAPSIPSKFTKPWVRITQLDATNVTGSSVEHLVEYMLQFDCYAGSETNNPRDEANHISRVVRSSLKRAEGSRIDGVAVTQVVVTSHIRLPDEAFDPWRERYVLDVMLRAHV